MEISSFYPFFHILPLIFTFYLNKSLYFYPNQPVTHIFDEMKNIHHCIEAVGKYIKLGIGEERGNFCGRKSRFINGGGEEYQVVGNVFYVF